MRGAAALVRFRASLLCGVDHATRHAAAGITDLSGMLNKHPATGKMCPAGDGACADDADSEACAAAELERYAMEGRDGEVDGRCVWDAGEKICGMDSHVMREGDLEELLSAGQDDEADGGPGEDADETDGEREPVSDDVLSHDADAIPASDDASDASDAPAEDE